MAEDPTLLLVDNDPAVLRVLERAAHPIVPEADVIATQSVTAALHILKQEPVTAIVSDYKLVDGTALEVLATSKAQRRGCKILVLSATPAVGMIALSAGANDFLSKPFSLTRLLQAIERLL